MNDNPVRDTLISFSCVKAVKDMTQKELDLLLRQTECLNEEQRLALLYERRYRQRLRGEDRHDPW